MKLNRTNAGIT